MTVAELIEKLRLVEQGLEVLVEGCDCLGAGTDVRTYVGPNDDDVDQTYAVIIRDGMNLD